MGSKFVLFRSPAASSDQTLLVAQLGTISGPLVGGAFTTGYTWRWCKYDCGNLIESDTDDS